MNKFIEKAIEKQDTSYSLKHAEKEFAWSCHLCATRNILHEDCVTCPVNVAHCRAVAEIRSGERDGLKPKKTHKTYSDRYGHITLVMREMKNATINVNISVNGKEAK